MSAQNHRNASSIRMHSPTKTNHSHCRIQDNVSVPRGASLPYNADMVRLNKEFTEKLIGVIAQYLNETIQSPHRDYSHTTGPITSRSQVADQESLGGQRDGTFNDSMLSRMLNESNESEDANHLNSLCDEDKIEILQRQRPSYFMNMKANRGAPQCVKDDRDSKIESSPRASLANKKERTRLSKIPIRPRYITKSQGCGGRLINKRNPIFQKQISSNTKEIAKKQRSTSVPVNQGESQVDGVTVSKKDGNSPFRRPNQKCKNKLNVLFKNSEDSLNIEIREGCLSTKASQTPIKWITKKQKSMLSDDIIDVFEDNKYVEKRPNAHVSLKTRSLILNKAYKKGSKYASHLSTKAVNDDINYFHEPSPEFSQKSTAVTTKATNMKNKAPTLSKHKLFYDICDFLDSCRQSLPRGKKTIAKRPNITVPGISLPTERRYLPSQSSVYSHSKTEGYSEGDQVPEISEIVIPVKIPPGLKRKNHCNQKNVTMVADGECRYTSCDWSSQCDMDEFQEIVDTAAYTGDNIEHQASPPLHSRPRPRHQRFISTRWPYRPHKRQPREKQRCVMYPKRLQFLAPRQSALHSSHMTFSHSRDLDPRPGPRNYVSHGRWRNYSTDHSISSSMSPSPLGTSGADTHSRDRAVEDSSCSYLGLADDLWSDQVTVQHTAFPGDIPKTGEERDRLGEAGDGLCLADISQDKTLVSRVLGNTGFVRAVLQSKYFLSWLLKDNAMVVLISSLWPDLRRVLATICIVFAYYGVVVAMYACYW